MNAIQPTFFFVVLAVVVAVLTASGAYDSLRYRRSKKLPYGNFETLLKRLSTVDRESVALVARHSIAESGQGTTEEDELDLDHSQIWRLIGGLEGLEVLEQNSAVLVELVFYVQQWYPGALVVAEQLRLNAREIEWHVGRLKAIEKTGKRESSFAGTTQRTVATYYLMTRRVLALYEQLNLPGVAELHRAL
jgi:hypothetical protein